MKPETLRISDWMRWWAPEVKKRIDRGEVLFAEVRDAYGEVRKAPDDDSILKACSAKMEECGKVLDEAPPGAYDYLVHVGKHVT